MPAALSLSHKHRTRLSLAMAIISWLALLILNLYIQFNLINRSKPGIASEVPISLFVIFLVFLLVYFRHRTVKAESVNFIDLLWKVFVTGLLATIVSLLIQFFFYILGGSKLASNQLVVNFFYHINLGLISAFLISTFIVYKRLILYQKNRALITAWQFFEYALLASLVLNFFKINIFDLIFNVAFFLLLSISIVLSVNLKWIAYLNFRQKWKSILLILLVILYLYYFLQTLLGFSAQFTPPIDPVNSVFVLSMMAFIFVYSIFSVLVILFNLPTSSVFEKKLEEVISFQRLSQSVQAEKNENRVYEILVESSYKAVLASAAWLEVYSGNSSKKNNYFTRSLEVSEVEEVIGYINKARIRNILESEAPSSYKSHRLTSSLKHPIYKSILVFPLIVQEKQIGSLALLKDVQDGFNREMIDIINTFVTQACISIENFHLMNEAIENERYKEELKIAKRVQRSLLPQELVHNQALKMAGFTEAADEVGGDYYDHFWIDGHRLALIIGDVSGKGTSAAFHMSQMKGVFHSLVQEGKKPGEFLIEANSALSRCLEKTSFITASYYVIDTLSKKLDFARAGHVPTLFFQKKINYARYFETRGLGLGILRNSDFSNYVEVNSLEYESGDLLFLYTDGITEARNNLGEEFGFTRLQNLLNSLADLEPEDIAKEIKNELLTFSGKASLDDDYTALIVKFL